MRPDVVRVVTAEGSPTRRGLLPYVLKDAGYEVVGEAGTTAELARELALHRPDVVLIDDGIGALAVGMTHEMVPDAKVLLVWPKAVVPIGGDARVDPSEILRGLAPAMARLTGASAAAPTPSASLADIVALHRGTREPAERVQAPESEAVIEDREDAPLLILPPSESVETAEPARTGAAKVPAEISSPVTAAELAAAREEAAEAWVVVPEAETPPPPPPRDNHHEPALIVPQPASAESEPETEEEAPLPETVPPVPATSTDAWSSSDRPASADRNRRLGSIALGGAAAAGTVVLALALGGSRLPLSEIVGEASSSIPPSSRPASPAAPASPASPSIPTTSPSEIVHAPGTQGDGSVVPDQGSELGTPQGGVVVAGSDGGGVEDGGAAGAPVIAPTGGLGTAARQGGGATPHGGGAGDDGGGSLPARVPPHLR